MRRKVLRFYRDDAGEHRWRLHAANGRMIAGPHEGYVKRGTCERNAVSVLGGEFLSRTPREDPASVAYGTVVGRDDVRVEWLP